MQIRYSDFYQCRSSSIDSVLRIRIRDPVLFWPLDPRSGKSIFRIPDRTHISESLLQFFGLKIITFLVNLFKSLSSACTVHVKKINNFQFCEIFSHCLVVFVKVNWREFLFFKLMDSCSLDPGSGMWRILIRDKHPVSVVIIPNYTHRNIMKNLTWNPVVNNGHHKSCQEAHTQSIQHGQGCFPWTKIICWVRNNCFQSRPIFGILKSKLIEKISKITQQITC
jgi:hypothetical protein